MLSNMRFDINENLTPNEKGNLNMFLLSTGRSDMLGKAIDGSFTRNDVKDLIEPLKILIANCEKDSDSNSTATQIGSTAKSILVKFNDFLG